MCVVLATLLLLTGVGLSRLREAQKAARGNPLQCQQNLQQIWMAFQDFATDHAGRLPWQVSMREGGSLESIPGGQAAPHFRSLTNTLRNARVLLCPVDPIRHRKATISTLEDSAISYFVNVSATLGARNQVLAGDRTLSPTPDATTGEIWVDGRSELQWASPTPGAPGHQTWEAGEQTGNLLFNSGTLMETTSPQLQRVVRSIGVRTNHFILP